MTNNIILLGFMGSGKTSVGKKLAERLAYDFIDTDQLIVEKAGMTIADIFSLYGEDYFRDLETQVLTEVLGQSRQVISTGGGVVLREENQRLIHNNKMTFSLMAAPDTIFSRVINDDSRPLLNDVNLYSKICALLKNRDVLYKKSPYIIWTDNLTKEEVALRIYKYVQGN